MILTSPTKKMNPIPNFEIRLGATELKLLKVFGNAELIFTNINKEVPFPIPYSVISSLNHKMITEPVVKVTAICNACTKFHPKTNGFKKKAIIKP